MPIRAFLFDFDGLILDTELPSRAGWRMLYREHGHELPEELWATLVGTTHAPWSPMEHLEELVGTPLEREALNERRYAYELSLIEAEELRPGIVDYLAATRSHGLRRAIVSSSSRRWIDMHIERFEEAVAFEDSPHGVRAAKAAGIFTVAVPNEVTRGLGLDDAGADLLLDSLAELAPDELLSRFATA